MRSNVTVDGTGVHVEGVLPMWAVCNGLWRSNDCCGGGVWEQSDSTTLVQIFELAVAVIQGNGRDVSGMVCMTTATVLPTPDSDSSHGDRLVAPESCASTAGEVNCAERCKDWAVTAPI